MPRIRSIKPEFFTDENLCQLSPHHRLAFEGLWCYADKQGRLKDRPGYLKTMILPYDNIDFNNLLTDLSKTNSGRGQPLINRYSVGGDNYIQVSNFAEHQRPHHTEKDSKLPAIPPLSNGYKTGRQREGKEGKGTVYEERIVAYFDSKISNGMIKVWREAHPTIDVQAEILKAKAWLFANQDKKQYSRFGRFLGNWMSNAANPPEWMREEDDTPDIKFVHEAYSEEQLREREHYGES